MAAAGGGTSDVAWSCSDPSSLVGYYAQKFTYLLFLPEVKILPIESSSAIYSFMHGSVTMMSKMHTKLLGNFFCISMHLANYCMAEKFDGNKI